MSEEKSNQPSAAGGQEEIELCPFCGETNFVEEPVDPDSLEESPVVCMTYIDGLPCIECSHCEYNIYGETEEEAIKNWNTRPIEDELRKENEELKKLNYLLAGEVFMKHKCGNNALVEGRLCEDKGPEHCRPDICVLLKAKNILDEKSLDYRK